MRFMITFSAILIVLLPASISGAQSPDKSLISDFVLGADDVLEINVVNHPELNRTILILPDGKISFPEVGELVAAGKTTSQLGSEIKSGLLKGRKNVDVNVLVREVKSRRVRIVGAVKNQGSFPLPRKLRLMDVVSLAGGFTSKPGKIRGKLSRDAQTIPLDVVSAVENPASDSNILLQPEDIILLDEVEPVYVYVAGQVERQGQYELDTNTTLMALLLRAGIKNDAAISKIHVARGTEPIHVAGLREAIIAGKPTDEVLKFQLKPGDQIFVPMLDQQYSVMGMVSRPGPYPVPETKTVLAIEALQLAAPIAGQADLAKAGIIRQEGGKATMIPINFDQFFKKQDFAQNPAIRHGDILYVPAKGQKGFQWQDLLTPLSALSVLGFRIWR